MTCPPSWILTPVAGRSDCSSDIEILPCFLYGTNMYHKNKVKKQKLRSRFESMTDKSMVTRPCRTQPMMMMCFLEKLGTKLHDLTPQSEPFHNASVSQNAPKWRNSRLRHALPGRCRHKNVAPGFVRCSMAPGSESLWRGQTAKAPNPFAMHRRRPASVFSMPNPVTNDKLKFSGLNVDLCHRQTN